METRLKAKFEMNLYDAFFDIFVILHYRLNPSTKKAMGLRNIGKKIFLFQRERERERLNVRLARM